MLPVPDPEFFDLDLRGRGKFLYTMSRDFPLVAARKATMAQKFSINRGFDLQLAGAPEQRVSDGPPVREAALLGNDTLAIRPKFVVAEGEVVRAGQTMFVDRARPDIAFTAPLSGTVTTIALGRRRVLSSVTVTSGPARTAPAASEPPQASPAQLRESLLGGGLWPAFRSRPLGRIPDPGATPAAIYVTAMDTEPLAADPSVVLTKQGEPFAKGLDALQQLTAGPVYLCQAPGPALSAEAGRLKICHFAGPHPAGLAGTHIDHLCPATMERMVWTVGYQDVVAIGDFLSSGAYPAARVVALAGPRAARPRLVRTCLGARLSDLTDGEVIAGVDGRPARLLSGSVLSGRDAAYLGRYDTQVTVLDGLHDRRVGGFMGWLAARWPAGGPRPIVPTAALDKALALDIPAVPLLRALSIGDAESAGRLGALDLIEEDLALASSLCTSQSDYGALLRRVLDDLAEAA